MQTARLIVDVFTSKGLDFSDLDMDTREELVSEIDGLIQLEKDSAVRAYVFKQTALKRDK